MSSERDRLAETWRQAAPTLRFPDPATAWVVVLAADFREPLADVAERLAAVHGAAPVVGARLGRNRWMPGRPDPPVVVDGDPLDAPGLLARFDLVRRPPLRVVLNRDARRIALAGHHAALDGRALLAVLVALAGGPIPSTADAPARPPATGSTRLAALRRLARPADPVAASCEPPAGRDERLAARDVTLDGRHVTARLAAAAVAAAGEHNRRAGAPWLRVGVSIGVGGPEGVGNVATYRRVDVTPGQDVEAAVSGAIAGPAAPDAPVPGSLPARLLAPVVRRFSDSLLVSNLGRATVPGAARIEFYPVARGRSAVAVGAAGLPGGPSTVTLRSPRLTRDDADAILDAIVARLGSG